MVNPGQPHVWIFESGPAQRAAGVYRTVASQPNWLLRLTLLVFTLAVALPILVLLLFAIFVAAVVFMVGAGVHRIMSWVRSLVPGSDGRENVRVIQRADEPM